MTEITDEDIQTLIAIKSQTTVGKNTGRRICKTTVNRTVIAPMRQLMNWTERKAKVRGMHSIDWSDLVLDEPPPRERVLSKDEKARLFEAGAREDDGHVVCLAFALLSGLRLDNFTSLRWDNVHFERSEVYRNGYVEVIQKRGRPHVIPMTVEMRKLLESQRGNHPEQVFTFTSRDTWANPKNQRKYVKGGVYPVSYWGFRGFFNRVAKAAGVPNIRPHDLRKTAGSDILNATGNLVAAQKLLGHSTAAQTAKAYAFLHTDVLLSAMEKASEKNSPTTRRAS